MQFQLRISCRSIETDFICGKYSLPTHVSGGIRETVNWAQRLQTLSTKIPVRLSGSKTKILHGSNNNSNCLIQDSANEAQQENAEMLGHICPLWSTMTHEKHWKLSELKRWTWHCSLLQLFQPRILCCFWILKPYTGWEDGGQVSDVGLAWKQVVFNSKLLETKLKFVDIYCTEPMLDTDLHWLVTRGYSTSPRLGAVVNMVGKVHVPQVNTVHCSEDRS